MLQLARKGLQYFKSWQKKHVPEMVSCQKKFSLSAAGFRSKHKRKKKKAFKYLSRFICQYVGDNPGKSSAHWFWNKTRECITQKRLRTLQTKLKSKNVWTPVEIENQVIANLTIWMSHWQWRATEGADFLISYKWLKLLRKADRLQVTTNSKFSTFYCSAASMWHLKGTARWDTIFSHIYLLEW
jgi:hypothetical protein